MIEQKIRNLTGQTTRSSLFLSRSLSEGIRVERNLEKKSLILKSKLVEERGRTLKNLASRDKGTQKGGILGGALGLLGLSSGGGLLRQVFRKTSKTPNSPNQLLRMQKGTSNLSRVSRVGRFARPLAVVGTGLDFVGRRAEGQTNLQAGVGAGGGLAGAIGGAKIGASIGTAILPGAGTAVGGIGGSIIGGLVGGNLTDLFTGANRRREFEEQRALIRSQKTLFSEALDDFDDVLDKFENVAIGLAIGGGGDTDQQRRRKRPLLPNIPDIGARILKFLRKPVIQATGVTLLTAGLITAAVVTRGKTVPASQKILEKVLAKSPFLRKLGEKEQIAAIGQIIERTLPKSSQQRVRMQTSPFLDKLGRFTPGKKGAPGISKKGKEIRNLTKAERDELASQRINLRDQRRIRRNKRLEEKIKKQEQEDAQRLKDIENDPMLKDAQETVVRQSGVDVNLDPNRLTKRAFEFIEKIKPQVVDRTTKSNAKASMDSINRRLSDQRTQILDKIDVLKEIQRQERIQGLTPKESTAIRLKDAQRALKIIEDFARKFVPKRIRQKGGFDVSSINPNPDSTNLAQASTGDIFLLGGNTNNNQQQTPPPIINPNTDLAMTSPKINSYRVVAEYMNFQSTLTT